jgi:hypothetical protein
MTLTSKDPIADAIATETTLLGVVQPDVSNDMRAERQTPCPAFAKLDNAASEIPRAGGDDPLVNVRKQIETLKKALVRALGETPRNSRMK